MTESFGPATWDERPQLARLWTQTFGEKEEAVAYYLDNTFRPEDCLVCRLDNQVAAMIHMVPAKMVTVEGLVQAHYIFAAATAAPFRSRGLMGRLLAEAFKYGEARGDVCSFLLPSEQSLYSYYGRHGYVPYFHTRFVEWSCDDLRGLTDGLPQAQPLGSFEVSHIAMRNRSLGDTPGSILWDERWLDFARMVNSHYGGSELSVEGDRGSTGYAFIGAEAEGRVEVSEILADSDLLLPLLDRIIGHTSAELVSFRLPDGYALALGEGELSRFGMARPLGQFTLPAPGPAAPYLGLTLD